MTNETKVRAAQQARRASHSDALTQYLASEQCDDEVRKYVDAALADNTLRAYRADLRHFAAWGGRVPATAERVATYIAHHATCLAISTLSRRLVAIARAHAALGLASPTTSLLVRATMQGVRRSQGCSARQVEALQRAQVLQMVRGLHGLRGLRDRALLLIGFSGAMRRSELVSLNVEDVRFTEEGVIIHLRRSKTDQEGRGRDIAIPRVVSSGSGNNNSSKGRGCATRHLERWLSAAAITTGALFRRVNRYDQVLAARLSAQSVALIVKQRAAAVGLEATQFSGHSLRAGFVTSAARAGASTSSIRAQTGHTSDEMLQRYIRDSDLFSQNANRKVW